MRFRLKHHPHRDNIGGSQFNTHGIGSVFVADQDELWEESIENLEMLVDGEWKPMGQAFRDRDLITDNYNTQFFPPPTPEDRDRGYTL